MTYIRLLLSVILAGTSFALVFRPETVPALSQLTETIGSQGKLSLLTAVAFASLYTLFKIKPSGSGREEFPHLDVIEEPETDTGEVIGEDVDALIEDGDTVELKKRLKEDAREVVVQSRGVDESKASKALESGSWTDRSTASAFLSASCSYPLMERFMEWLEEDRTRKRVSKTVEALEEEYYEGSER